MYQLNERREHRHESMEGSGEVRRAHRTGTSRPETRLRVVRVPGGFAFVEDKPATDSTWTITQ
jgi:hypothetical protein